MSTTTGEIRAFVRGMNVPFGEAPTPQQWQSLLRELNLSASALALGDVRGRKIADGGVARSTDLANHVEFAPITTLNPNQAA